MLLIVEIKHFLRLQSTSIVSHSHVDRKRPRMNDIPLCEKMYLIKQNDDEYHQLKKEQKI